LERHPLGLSQGILLLLVIRFLWVAGAVMAPLEPMGQAPMAAAVEEDRLM